VLRLTASGAREDAFWRLAEAPAEAPGPFPARAYRRLLFQAVGDCLPGTSPVAMKLSGGLDSSSVAVVADQILADRGAAAPRVVGWTAERHIDDPTGELPWARRLTRGSGIQVRPIYADATASSDHRCRDPHDVGATADRGAAMALPRPQPVAEARPILQRRLLAHASAGGPRVLLTGQGGDLLLSPEPTFFPRLVVRGRWVAAAAAVLAARRPLGRWPPLYLRSWAQARWRRRPWARGQRPPGFPTWLTREAVAAHGLEEMWRATMAGTGARGTGGCHRPHFAHFADPAFWQAVAEYEDPAAVGIPMVARHPLLEPRLLALARDLPPVPWCVDKFLARRAMTGLLPDALRTRPKARGTPQAAAITLSEAQRSLVAAPWLVQEGFVDGPGLEKLAAAYAAGEVSAAAFQAVTAVVSFEEWRASTLRAVAAG
ncbi:MAG: asparagine synthase-related protein, partial [Anaerolineae bacterium]